MVRLRSGAHNAWASVSETHLITGGGGYVGYNLGKALTSKGYNVVLFDIREPYGPVEGMEFIKGDIRNVDEVMKACEGVDCVYHMASYGMSGREQLNKNLIEGVNIQGTKNVLEACKHHGITRLVYTSTFNVVFGGQEIKNGDESLPYFPLDKHPDNYSRTKSIAEQEVLSKNNMKLSSGKTLKSCALRLAGVYGPGEQRHLPRIVDYIECGLFAFTYGKKDSLVEFLHVDNLVQAHVLAGEALSDKKQNIAAGQAYFISDCKPVNNFEFFRPLVEGLGYKYPTINLPVTLIYYIAFLTELIHSIVGRIYNFQPLLTRTEVYKTGITHYFSNSKAQKQLGYAPTVQNQLDEVVNYFLQNGHGKKQKKHSSLSRFLQDIIIIFIFAALVLSFVPIVR